MVAVSSKELEERDAVLGGFFSGVDVAECALAEGFEQMLDCSMYKTPSRISMRKQGTPSA